MSENLDKPLVNRVAQSGLVTLNLENLFPKEEVISFDLKDYLFMGMVLREKDFRDALDQHDWLQYRGKNLAVFCSADAIIPVWAYMLVITKAQPFAVRVFQGDVPSFYAFALMESIHQMDLSAYAGQKVMIKGCSHKPVPVFAYAEVTHRLLPVAQSIMYGEACSTVPVYKKPKAKNDTSE